MVEVKVNHDTQFYRIKGGSGVGHLVHRGGGGGVAFSTLGDAIRTPGAYHDEWGDIMSTALRVQCTRGIS